MLTEATSEFAFFMMGALARKMWSAEHLLRENKWGYWHPYLPFLGDEVTGKTLAVIGTGRIGLALIKKCTGFDMNILCYDPAYQNHEYVKAIQEMKDLRYARGIQKEKTWIKYAPFEDALGQADFVSVHVPLLREGESTTPTYHLFNERTLRQDEANGISGEYLAWTGDRGGRVGKGAKRAMDCRGGLGCVRGRTATARLTFARSGDRRSMPAVSAFCQRGPDYATLNRSEQGHGGTVCAGFD